MDTSSLLKIPGYNYNEYLLVLNPREDLHDKIMLVKKEFAGKYTAPIALQSRPHITLANFVQFEMIEERLLNRLKIIAMGHQSFKVELKDYGSFPSHTIFINVESKQQVQNLVKELRPAQQLMTLNKDNKPHFINDPHLTIARKLLPWQYEQGWADFSHRYFTGRFIAEEMLLLKRRIQPDKDHQIRKYQVVQGFEFMNLPVATKQGELFM
ncbi:MAG: 2'-5' RNA ligase family protein [Bacteroidota bacterium]|nr:2'-5' RNA ligase family protein [Bacteroidota bacterium]